MSTEQQKTTETSTEGLTQRVITVITTRGEKAKVAFEGNSWVELKKVLEKGGKDVEGKTFAPYSLSQMKCVESVNRGTLEHPTAVIPNGNFNLYLMPIKSKSGSMSRADANSQIKALIARDGDTAKAVFNAGKNYTNKATDELIALLEQYSPGSIAATQTNKGEAVAQIVDSVKQAKTPGNLSKLLAGLTLDEKLDLAINLLLDFQKGGVTSAGTEEAPSAVATIKEEPKETEEQKKQREQKEEEERERQRKKKEDDEETKRLQDEMKDLMGGFSDVQR